MNSDLHALSIRALMAGYQARAFSPVDVWDAVAARIEAWEPRVGALYAYDPAAARLEAETSAGRWRRGEPAGVLDGVPVTVKELIATTGVAVPQGSAATLLEPSPADAPPAARLREAGAIIFAKTTSPDYGMLSSGLSSFHQLARNPWNLGQNPGGSSAGAGAAAAAGYGPLHIGTDIGGSIRLPAGWCGLVGHKPSFGRVPIDPYYIGRVAGPMTRHVEDAAIAMSVLSRPDPRDATSLPQAEIDWSDLRREPFGLKIGVMMDAGCGMPVDPEIVAAIARAVEIFERAGATVTPVAPIMEPGLLDGIDDFFRARIWAGLSALPAARRALVLPYILQWAATADGMPASRVIAGLECSFTLRRRAASLFQTVDAVLSPTSPVVSFPAEAASPTGDPMRPFDHIGFTLPWNLGEQPAISLCCGMSASGMPIGLQIVGPRFDDLGVLRLARFHEAHRGFEQVWPAP